MERPRVIITADDFGLSPELDLGIVDGHVRGLVTSASLLANAPATEHAVELARRHPTLEVGLHLGLVEGFALSGPDTSLTDPLAYLGNGEPCLHRHWTRFLARYLAGRIDLGELERELALQIERFLTFFPAIPFANSTQHLHLLPGVLEVVLGLARRHGIGALRIPRRPRLGTGLLRRRGLQEAVLAALGRRALRAARQQGLRTTDHFPAFPWSGRLTARELTALLAALPPGTTEIMTHPGFDCPRLRNDLPWAYASFGWPEELAALTSPTVRRTLEQCGADLIQFRNL